jgi:hypothetical protein
MGLGGREDGGLPELMQGLRCFSWRRRAAGVRFDLAAAATAGAAMGAMSPRCYCRPMCGSCRRRCVQLCVQLFSMAAAFGGGAPRCHTSPFLRRQPMRTSLRSIWCFPCATTLSTTEGSAKHTKPKPRGRPVLRSKLRVGGFCGSGAEWREQQLRRALVCSAAPTASMRGTGRLRGAARAAARCACWQQRATTLLPRHRASEQRPPRAGGCVPWPLTAPDKCLRDLPIVGKVLGEFIVPARRFGGAVSFDIAALRHPERALPGFPHRRILTLSPRRVLRRTPCWLGPPFEEGEPAFLAGPTTGCPSSQRCWISVEDGLNCF